MDKGIEQLQQWGTYINTYHEIERIYEEGLVKAIGICNCNRHHLEELLMSANVIPAILETECHPLFTNDTVINYCRAFDIKVVAYTPLGRMHDVLIKSKPIRSLAKKYATSQVKIILSWHILQGRIPIPSTLNKEHFDEMFDGEIVKLDMKELSWISSLNDNIRLRYNPDMCDFWSL